MESPNKITYKNIVKILDERFKKKNILYEHLHMSYNDYLKKIIYILENTNWIFERNKVDNVIYTYYFKFTNVMIRPPMLNNKLLYPNDAILNNRSYMLKLIGSVTQYQSSYDLLEKKMLNTVETGGEVKNMEIMQIPVMIGSKGCSSVVQKLINSNECPYDTGGYFIIKGKEKIIIPKERKIENKTLIYKKKEGSGQNVFEIYQAEINSKAPTSLVQSIKIKLKKNMDLMFNVPIFHEISVFILLRALGLETDYEIVHYIMQNDNDYEMLNILKVSIENSKKESYTLITNKETAINYLINRVKVKQNYSDEENAGIVYLERKEFLKFVLMGAFMPHIDNNKYDNPLRVKALFICNMINKLLRCYLGRIQIDDRDLFINKRVELPGDILYEETMKAVKKILHEINKVFTKRTQGSHINPPNIINQWKEQTVGTALINLLSKGENSEKTKTGISQPLPRVTRMQSITFLRRIDSPSVEDSTKITGPRHYNASQIGFIDSIESPEHENIGLVKHLACLATISIENKLNTKTIYDFLIEHKNFKHINNLSMDAFNNTKIFLNGEWLGITENPIKIYENLKTLKTNEIITRDCGISFDIQQNEIKVHTESGRLIREIFKVKNNELIITNKMIEDILTAKVDTNINKWELLKMQHPEAIDTIDSDEQFFSLISQTQDELIQMYNNGLQNYKDSEAIVINRYDNSLILNYTHCEIHPVILMGMMSSSVYFANHNQGPRNIYQFAQGKQALGIPTANYRNRMDITHILYHTQNPLIQSITAKYSGRNILPCGENAIVIQACYTGMNIEDSNIMNQSSIDRGLFRSSEFKIFESKIDKNQTTGEDGDFKKPSQETQTSKLSMNYEKLNENGYAPVGTELVNNDVIICKITPYKDNEKKNIYYKNTTEIYKGLESALVDKVITDITNAEDYKMIKVKLNIEKIPRVGDKFCCYTDEHEVLTFNGWKNVKDITMTDKIACLENNDTLIYNYPTHIYKYDIEDELYEIDGNISFQVTKNHRMYIKDKNKTNYEIKTAEEIYNTPVYYKTNIEKYNFEKCEYFEYDEMNNQKYFIVNENLKININNWCVIYGIWSVCGKIYNNKLYFNTNKSSINKLIKNIFSDFISNEKKIEIIDESIKKYLLNKKDNEMPLWTKYLNTLQCKLLIYGIIASSVFIVKTKYDKKSLLFNGNKEIINFNDFGTKEKIIFRTTLKNLANELQQLCFHAGYVSFIEKNINDEKWIIHTITINDKPKEILMENGKYIPFKGNVYCCTVPNDGIIYTRRNGRVCWGCNSMHGQKSTVGLTLSSSDMPFTESGLVPDIIINPHAIPRRMTTGHIMEQKFSKLAVLKGMRFDGTPFQDINYEEISKELENFGFDKSGREIMYDGFSGRKMNVEIYIGPIYYQRLRHLVSNKVHAIALGPTTLMTRQPTGGRSKDGGLRIGEMERDALISHGLSLFLKERLVDCSDIYESYVCDICGLFAKRIVLVNSDSNPSANDKYECVNCRNTTKISKIIVPYAFKLLCNELMAMCIAPRIKCN